MCTRTLLMVETKAMGRGTTEEMMRGYRMDASEVEGSKERHGCRG